MTTRDRREAALDLLAADMACIQRFSARILRRPLRPYQLPVANAVLHSVRHGLGLTFACMMSRQAGKNEVAAHIEAYLLNRYARRGGQIVKASPTFKPQTINSILRLQTVFNGSLLPPCEGERGYILRYGAARCVFYSASPDANVVGATADLLLEADEAQDILAEKWDKDYRPMGASTNVTCVLWGTPWTSSTLLAHTIRRLRALEGRDGIRRVFLVPWREVARCLPAYGQYVRAEIDRLGADHPLVRTQYELQEIDEGSRMFSPALCSLMQGTHPRQDGPRPGARYVFALDVGGAAEEAGQLALLSAGTRHDRTALTIAEVCLAETGLPRFLVRRRYGWVGVSHAILHSAVAELAARWAPQCLVVDATGVGAGLASFLRAALGERVLPYHFTQSSKSRLGWDFLALCNSGRFCDHALDDSPEQAQFWREVRAADYQVLAGPERALRWGVADPAVHDDYLISAALCAAVPPERLPHSGPSHVIESPDFL